MAQTPETWNISANESLTDLWVAGRTSVERRPEGLIICCDSAEEATSLLFKLNMHRRAVEHQRHGGKPWCREVSLRKVEDGLQFVRAAGGLFRVKDPDTREVMMVEDYLASNLEDTK